jgi:hypothetical protein
LSKNTRWALAIVGVVIIVVGAFVIGTGKDNTDAVQKPTTPATEATGPTQTTVVTPQTGSTGSGNDSNSGSKDNSNSGGASPNDSGDDSGGASPVPGEPKSLSGGAEAHIDAVSPVLSDIKVQTVIAKKGDSVMIRGISEEDGEMHVHGYDKEKALKSGKITRITFKATIDGEFPIEFHLSSGEVKVGILRVNP